MARVNMSMGSVGWVVEVSVAIQRWDKTERS